ncbi:hypothetical protein [uncultured Psychroserpens sp.]|uniref:hypothetical protein n=1 Tax=uncultured Psychroserpens sp. TaxID=255436 RepID=UPI00261153B4|nr:hypothetical protein [uncultured Psychroserpens sp.]
MTTFEDLKSQWKNQPQQDIPSDGSESILKKLGGIKRKQIITNVILGATVLILIVFFTYIKAYNSGLISFALSLMIGSLLVRIGIEYFSIKKLKAIDITVSASVFSKNMVSYYKKRIRIHYIATPIIILAYCIGFVLMLPSFEKHLSSGFYTYIVFSSIIILVVMVFFIGKQIKKELSILKEISN